MSAEGRRRKGKRAAVGLLLCVFLVWGVHDEEKKKRTDGERKKMNARVHRKQMLLRAKLFVCARFATVRARVCMCVAVLGKAVVERPFEGGGGGGGAAGACFGRRRPHNVPPLVCVCARLEKINRRPTALFLHSSSSSSKKTSTSTSIRLLCAVRGGRMCCAWL